MSSFINWHKKYIKWFQKKLNLSNYAIIWITFIKGVFIGLLIYHFFISTESHAQTLRIIDGDTIVINDEKIRFSGIDSPELKQTCIQDEQNVYCGIFAKKLLAKKIGNKIINGLKKIRNEIRKNKFIFRNKYEDIHLNIEKRLYEIIGDDAGYLHIARSRNDQVITDFKLWIKNSSNEIINNLNNLIESFIKKAEKNIYTIMPGFTHLKNAQAVSFAHYLLAT